jgi:multidrug efflux pump subunit AcrA (membrane-fusion protein)
MNGNGTTRGLGANGRRVLFFSVGGALVMVLVVAVVLVTRANRITSSGLYTVEKGTLRIVITEDGVLAAKESEKVVADIEAQAKIVWLIDEGTFVTKDTKLVELDKTQLQDFLESLQLDLITLDANYKSAEGKLKVLKAEGPQQLEKLRFEVEKARARHEKAVAQLPREEFRDVYSESELRDAQIAVDEALMNLEAAKLALELYEDYTCPQNVRDAEASLEKAKRLYESQVEKEKEVTAQLEKMELVAPSDGLVIYGSGEEQWWRHGEQEEVAVGSNVYKGQVVIVLPNVTMMQAVIKVHETDFPKIKKGLPATVRVLASKQEFKGAVEAIGALARERDGWRSQGVKVFDVKVDVEGRHPYLRPGLTARVDILVDEIADVLLIPVEAVRIDPGTEKRYCYVRTASGYEERPVTLGQSNNSYVIVTDGLKRGEQVYQYDPTAKID